MCIQKRFLSVVMAFWVIPVCAVAATTLVIPGNANIFGAGHLAPPPSPDTPFNQSYPLESAPGVLPPGVAFEPDPYLVLRFESVTGGVGYNMNSGVAGGDGFSNQPGPDGTLLGTNVTSTAGISGLSKDNRILFLVGVFLGPDAPLHAPPALNYNNADNQLNFAPALGQTFFIGDGFTNSALQQNFYVPTGATRLFLGFVDAWHFQGEPSWYGDNHGQLVATFDFHHYNPEVPDPATAWLVAVPLAVLWYRRARKRPAA